MLRMLKHIGMISCKRGSGNYLTDNVSRSVSEMHMMLLLGQTDQAEICSFRLNMEKASAVRSDEKSFSRWETQVAEILHQPAKHRNGNADRADRRFHIHPGDRKPVLDCLLEPIADVYRKWIDAALQSANDFVKDSGRQSIRHCFMRCKTMITLPVRLQLTGIMTM
ncbi:MAG: hypothetical protein ACLT29_05015 [Ruminococcus callidus]